MLSYLVSDAESSTFVEVVVVVWWFAKRPANMLGLNGSDNWTCCSTGMEVADQTFYLSQSQYFDSGPTSPINDPLTPDDWQNSRWSTEF